MTENKRKKYLAEIEEAIMELPEKAQEAVWWTIKHFDFVEEMCVHTEMTLEELAYCQTEARAKEVI